MVKRAVVVGTNYMGTPEQLQGCVNDALGWQAFLVSRGYRVLTFIGENATRRAILETLRNQVEQSRFGDRIVFTYSGHGSWLPDMDGDELDARDEVLCPDDFRRNGVILDDELQAIFSRKRFGVRVTVISDSCHSGTVSRYARTTIANLGHRPRFIHPINFLPVDSAQWRRALLVEKREQQTAPHSKGAVLFSGCTDEEYSYDAVIEGKAQGAFSWAALKALQADPGASYSRLYRAIADKLPSPRYPQSPQLYASLWQRRWTF